MYLRNSSPLRFPMLKTVLFAVVALVAIPSLTSAQDIFWSFSQTDSTDTTSLEPGDTASAYIFSDGLLGFDSIDLNFSVSDSSVVQLTGGEAFNPTFSLLGGLRFDAATLTVAADGSSGNLGAFNLFQNGVDPGFAINFDPGFDPSIGPNGALLLARVDFEVIGEGAADFDFSLGPQGLMQLPGILVIPTLGSATANSTSLSILGDVNMDSSVNMFDIPPFILILFNRGFQIEADVNVNGVVDFFDIIPFSDILLAQ